MVAATVAERAAAGRVEEELVGAATVVVEARAEGPMVVAGRAAAESAVA